MATRTWTGLGDGYTWTDANNWSDTTVPTTGDTAIVTAENAEISGTPSADVLALVTVGANTTLNVSALEATAFVFNDSVNYSPLTGGFVFNGIGSQAGSITGDCAFNGDSSNSGNITGACEFSDRSYNEGDITGDCAFYDSGQNTGSITGNADFNATAYSSETTGGFNPQQGTVSGTTAFPNGAVFTLAGMEQWDADTSGWTGTLAWVFNGESYNSGILFGDCQFNDSSSNSGTITGACEFNGGSVNSSEITGDCDFYDDSFNNTGGIITGGASFKETEYSTAASGQFYPNLGTVNGTIGFPNGATFTLETGEIWNADTSLWTGGALAWVFNGNSYNNGNISGSCSFYGNSYNAGYVTGNCDFHDSSYNGGTIYGDAFVRQPVSDFVVWRDYVSSTYVTGTLHLRFPELDILGTGLL
jgi:hypothetical protein